MSNKVITFAHDVMIGDRLTSGYVSGVTEDRGIVTLTLSAYPGSLIEEALVLKANALVTVLDD